MFNLFLLLSEVEQKPLKVEIPPVFDKVFHELWVIIIIVVLLPFVLDRLFGKKRRRD